MIGLAGLEWTYLLAALCGAVGLESPSLLLYKKKVAAYQITF
nr:hypothetical protein [Polynucleobacter necessarius]